ncbi:MAG TPA: response regulator transcription factor [Brevibacterium sp.]|nr:response regulator transcription factor [Brevibacterium sp.]
MTVRVLVCDDHPVVRAGITALLATDEGIDVVGEAATGEDIVRLAADVPADLVLMDLQLGGGDGVVHGAEATRRIRGGGAAAPHVLVLTNYDSDADVVTAIEAGAAGYLLKDTPPDQLLDGIRRAAAGETALSPDVTAMLMKRMRTPAVSLSMRELEVVEAVADGLSNSQIAGRLFVSESTVKTHLAHVFEKLGARSRTDAVARAREAGLIRG